MLRILSIIVLVSALAHATQVEVCKSGAPACDSVIIPDCDVPPCIVYKEALARQYVTFTAVKELTSLKPAITARALGITLNYDVDEDQLAVCDNLEEEYECPIQAGDSATWIYTMITPSIYPAIKIDLDIALVDQDEDTVCCFNVAIQLKDALN